MIRNYDVKLINEINKVAFKSQEFLSKEIIEPEADNKLVAVDNTDDRGMDAQVLAHEKYIIYHH